MVLLWYYNGIIIGLTSKEEEKFTGGRTGLLDSLLNHIV